MQGDQVERQRFESSLRLSACTSRNSFLSGRISRYFPSWSQQILPLMRQSTISSKMDRSVSSSLSISLLPTYSKRMVRQEASMMVNFSFFMLNSSRSLTLRYFSLSGLKLRFSQLRWNCQMSWRSQASMREMSSWTSFQFLKGMEASWQRELYLPSLRRRGFSMRRLMSTLVLRISLSQVELPYLAFQRKASATQRALFSQLLLRYMISAMANFSTEMWPSLMYAQDYSVGILSSISWIFSLMSSPVNLLNLISRLYSSSSTLAGCPSSSWLSSMSWKSSPASLASLSSMAFSSSMRQDLTLICGSSSAMNCSRSFWMCLQSLALRMLMMDLMEFSVYFSCWLSCEMRWMVDLRLSSRLFLLQICSS